jgi:hypothetical protein
VALVLIVVALDRLLPGARLQLTAIPLVLGALALLFRFTSGPPLVVLLLAGLIMTQVSPEFFLFPVGRPVIVAETIAYRVLLAAAVLAFVIAFYRRLAIQSGVFPPDRRRAPAAKRGRKPAPLPQVKRSAESVTLAELAALLPVLIGSAAAGFFVWLALNRVSPPEGVFAERELNQWRLIVICCAIIACGVCALIPVTYLNRARGSATQNLLYLQDVLWRETRKEQGRINRWLARVRMRRRRLKETS